MSNRRCVHGQSWMFPASLLKSHVSTFEGVMGDDDGNGRYDLGFRVVQDAECLVLRGGSWGNGTDSLRAAWRFSSYGHYDRYGFRVVCDE